MSALHIEVRRATEPDIEALSAVMAAAFMTDPVSEWIFPNRDERECLHPDFFRHFVDVTVKHGEVYTVNEGSGVALWLSVDGGDSDSGDPDFHHSMVSAIGVENAKRFSILDELMAMNHPTRPHAYLPFIGVNPVHQGQGLGAALLRHRLAQLDSTGTAAYLEASCQRNAALYERLGFRRMPTTLDLPGGPSLYPMWREPA